jgi:hypothetical protein
MRSQEQLHEILTSLINGWEGECVEFKEAGDGFPTSDIGKYFSALSNEANLRANSSAWLVFGVKNSTRKVEGRKPNIHVAAAIAAVTDTEAEYLHHRAFDDRYFCDLIVDYLKTFGSAKRTKLNRLLENKVSDLLTPAQKRGKIDRLLKRLQLEGKIRLDGYGKGGTWIPHSSADNENA